MYINFHLQYHSTIINRVRCQQNLDIYIVCTVSVGQGTIPNFYIVQMFLSNILLCYTIISCLF